LRTRARAKTSKSAASYAGLTVTLPRRPCATWASLSWGSCCSVWGHWRPGVHSRRRALVGGRLWCGSGSSLSSGGRAAAVALACVSVSESKERATHCNLQPPGNTAAGLPRRHTASDTQRPLMLSWVLPPRCPAHVHARLLPSLPPPHTHHVLPPPLLGAGGSTW
jgi:hypothetical protein